eukprot:CAMPEP_0194242542 /NCGR_PEP_ID=MMETSP0158-20130606/8050_1 /TAXON_ID=33649 /ORGANISM="Thalassionema nitzschioides, Strain L26-B" /LENGTH=887 /DNA_ID=CAMNT_0038977653 /DNA_START=118 /DNA_END=2781 /DNA_ORIENTATION=+
MSTYLRNLNEAQVEAVTQPTTGITRVVAGPGAGKTRVLTCRIAHLLKEDLSSRVLAVTFTKKAAGEMQERVQKLLEEDDNSETVISNDDASVEEVVVNSLENLNRVTLGTFHSVCAKILRWNGKQLSTLPSVQESMMASKNVTNLDGSFGILDQGDQLRVVKDYCKELQIDLKKEKDVKVRSILSALGKLKLGELESKDIRRNRALRIANDIYPYYRQHLFATNSLDFDDLIYMTRELLQTNVTIRDSLRKRWPHVLIDEFQDTSQAQLDLVQTWTSNSLFVVGDADQSIYSWRGANVESMTDFEKTFSQVSTVYLMENYRSTTNIVKAAQKVITSSTSNAAADLRQDMKPMRDKGQSLRVLACANGKAEASYVVKTIKGMIVEEQILPDQTVAVLYRTNAQSRALEEACVENNLPYVIWGAMGTFYSRAEIKDCLCFLRWLSNGRDESAMLRAFKTPARGLGDKSVLEFQAYYQRVYELYSKQQIENIPSPLDLLIAIDDESSSIIPEAPNPEDLISKRAINRLKEFSMQMNTIRKLAYKESVSNLIKSIIDILGLKEHFDSISKSTSEFADRWNNVQELRKAAEKYSSDEAALQPSASDEDARETPLVKFLDDVALVTQVSDDDEGADSPKKANLMTIHASKGMEFDVVFVVGNEDGTFPTTQAINEGEGSTVLDEERRLCYVAMTRAKDQLVMTWRREVSYFEGEFFRKSERERSRFLSVLVSKKKEDKSRNGQREDLGKRRTHSRAANEFSTRKLSTRTNQGQPRNNLDSNQKLKKVKAPTIKATFGRPPSRNIKGDMRSSKEADFRYTTKSTPTQKHITREKKPDSTWFFPVGSSIVHLRHGAGTVLPPPPDQNGEMMVRIKFDSSGEDLDLPANGRDIFPN